MLSNYLKIAWRNLLKSKGTSFINISGLAVGMSVAMMIGLWMHDELTYNKVHQNYDRLAQAYIHQSFNATTTTSPAISLPLATTLREEFASDFTDIALASWSFDHTLSVGEKILLEHGMHVEPAFPKMFSLDLLRGTYEDVLKEPNSILIAESLAKTLFADADPVGKIVRLDQKYDQMVTGVFKDLPYNSELREIKFLLTWAFYLADNEWVKNAQTEWGNHSFQLYAQITHNADFETVSAKIKDSELKHNKDGNPAYFLFPMDRWHLYSRFEEGVNTGGRIQFVWLFGIIGVFVLLLACINFMNLSTARSEKRAKEVGIRKAIGSLRGQLIRQFLSESLMVSVFALIVSILLLQLSLPAFNVLADKKIEIPWSQPALWTMLAGFTCLTGLLAGSYPAFYLSSFQPLKVLKGTFRIGRWASLPRKALVVVQFTVSIALIIGTLVVFNQIQHAKNRPVGYNREGILQVFISRELFDNLDVLRDNLLKTGAVNEVSHSMSPVTAIWSNQIGFDWDGKDPNTLPIFGILNCTPEFGRTIGWEIIEGRDFSREFATDTAAIILNEAGVKLTGLTDIVGKIIRWNDNPYHVIGVIKDMIMESPYTPVKPTVFCMAFENWKNVTNIKLQPGVPVDDALAKVEKVYKTLAPQSVFEFNFTDDQYESKFRAEERIGKLARVFAILAIFISCLGLFGLSAFVAEQRTKEIGIRKVLGASIANLWAMQSRGFVGLVIISCLIATPLAWYFLNNWLAQYEYRIDLRYHVFLVAGFLAITVTMLTVSFQSIKAALTNPVTSLRSE